MTRYRWLILSLLFLVTTNNYLDRIVFSVLIPVIREDLHISTQQYSYITASFQFAYTVGFLFMGKLIDRFGTRIGYAVSIAWWSAAACMHAVARTALQMGFWRGLLGLGEAGNFPSAIKAVAEWFPKKDRAFATGIFNAGTNVASMIGPPIFVWMAAKYGWRDCFLITGGVGFILVVIWWMVYRLPEHHPSVNAQELAYIKSDVEEAGGPKVGWLEALRYKETWGFALGKFLTDPVWWFYLVWLPPYLYDVRKFNLTEVGWALPVVYLMADVGSVGGGWLSGFLMRRGWPNHRARKTAMGICAGLMPIAAMSVLAPSPVLAIALVSIATASHQGWSANLFTTTSDVFPKQAVASVTGIGGCMGGVGGVLFSALLPGYVVSHFGYTPIFLGMGLLHLTALLVVHKLLGKMQPIQVAQR
ncbi:MAG: MFS transporter [Bryobacteraceae bacterium]|nr:MFS transporter [Bryobacteraceae bacterium]